MLTSKQSPRQNVRVKYETETPINSYFLKIKVIVQKKSADGHRYLHDTPSPEQLLVCFYG
jgi:hypothetical protein